MSATDTIISTTPATADGSPTVVFIPAPVCRTPFIPNAACRSATCTAIFFPLLRDVDGVVNKCLPSYTSAAVDHLTPIYQYTSASSCPPGMVMAAVTGSPNNTVLCCPSGLRCPDDSSLCSNCTGITTAGEFLMGEITGVGTMTITATKTYSPDDHVTISLRAALVTLIPEEPSSTSTNPGLTPSPTGIQSQTSTTASKALIIASIVGPIVAVFLLLSLLTLFFWVIRKRRRRRQSTTTTTNTDPDPANKSRPSGVSTDDYRKFKPELDAVDTTRAELEGTAPEDRDRGAGIYVPKPELEAGMLEIGYVEGGNYVRRKAELDGCERGVRVGTCDDIKMVLKKSGLVELEAQSWI
ncbi:hypothetical protein F4777DRAFT_582902 [Nemania sp. FL0916]|nr:hypothetical protein F4777DRAFT_582902 [Nemania sp. FL0916]